VKVIWSEEWKKLGYIGEKEMWLDLYKANSLTSLSQKFNCSINAIRDRFAKCGVPLRGPGGPNNQKFEVDRALIDDITATGVRAAALKRGVAPQTLYQRLYYSKGLSVKKLQQAAEALKEEEPNGDV